jgi:hypothetical protein
MVAVIWLVVAALAVVFFTSQTGRPDVPNLVGTEAIDPADLLSDPTLLLTEPGILGQAIAQEAARLVGECMAGAGFAYHGVPGIERVNDVDLLLASGYGLGQSLTIDADLADLAYLEGLGSRELDDYEAALYGGNLRDLAAGALPGGCARAGLDATLDRLTELEGLSPSIGEILAIGIDDDEWRSAGERWFGCMADRLAAVSPLFALDPPVGLFPFAPDFGDPDTFLSFLIAGLDAPFAAGLGEVEAAIAGADATCREAFEAGTSDSLDALARLFVAENARLLGDLLGGSDE